MSSAYLLTANLINCTNSNDRLTIAQYLLKRQLTQWLQTGSISKTIKGKNHASGANSDRNPDGTIQLRNPHIAKMPQDFLYHLNFGTNTHDLVQMFGDVKFICMGGTQTRMQHFANYMKEELGLKLPIGTSLCDLSNYRYSMYKIGPVLSISHGMGVSSIGILLHEVIKLIHHAKIKDPVFFRIGTSGGIGVKPGTVVVSDGAVDDRGNQYYELAMLGKPVRRPALLDRQFATELAALSVPTDLFDIITGTTMCANDFYEGQARVDGAFCDYTEEDKMQYLHELQQKGVRNIEMEVVPFAAFTHHAGIKAAVVCVTLVDRLKGDQVSIPQELIKEWQLSPQIVVGRYIKKYLESSQTL